MKKYVIIATLLSALVTLPIGWLLGARFGWPLLEQSQLLSPLLDPVEPAIKEYPLAKFSIGALAQYPYSSSNIEIEEILVEEDDYTSYLFSYQTMGKKMTGQVNIPSQPAPASGFPTILMLRGWAPQASYRTGVGTSPAAAVLARAGFVTIAPDFFGYGSSDPEFDDAWLARFQKPIQVIELLKSVEAQPQLALPATTSTTVSSATVSDTSTLSSIKLNTNSLGFWAHSNGGQIALTVLEVLQRPIPTTLWAPVTAPFPYSILYFSDEEPDEGKSMRKNLSLFETDYDVFDFSLTQHLNLLMGPIQLHQGTADEAVPVVWSNEFVDKIKAENIRRKSLQEAATADQLNSTQAAENEELNPLLPEIDFTYHVYPGSDHNLRPAWDTVVQRDLQFFQEQFELD